MEVLQKSFGSPVESTVVASVTDTQTHTHTLTFGLLGLLLQPKTAMNEHMISRYSSVSYFCFCTFLWKFEALQTKLLWGTLCHHVFSYIDLDLFVFLY